MLWLIHYQDNGIWKARKRGFALENISPESVLEVSLRMGPILDMEFGLWGVAIMLHIALTYHSDLLPLSNLTAIDQ